MLAPSLYLAAGVGCLFAYQMYVTRPMTVFAVYGR